VSQLPATPSRTSRSGRSAAHCHGYRACLPLGHLWSAHRGLREEARPPIRVCCLGL